MHRGSLGFGRSRLKTTSIFYQQSFIFFFFHKLFPNLHQINIRVPTNEKSNSNKLKKNKKKTILIQQHTLWRRRRSVLCSGDTRRITTRRSPGQSLAPPTSAIYQNENQIKQRSKFKRDEAWNKSKRRTSPGVIGLDIAISDDQNGFKLQNQIWW